jgi:formylmethanofuran dehydrogenase subunit E
MLRKYTNTDIKTGKKKCSKCGKSVKIGYVITDENKILCKDCNQQENTNE